VRWWDVRFGPEWRRLQHRIPRAYSGACDGQLAHPYVATGVATHSRLTAGVQERFFRTMKYMFSVSGCGYQGGSATKWVRGSTEFEWCLLVSARAVLSMCIQITYGTQEDALQSARTVRRMHDAVHGTIGEDVGGFRADSPYSAHNVHSLSWVMTTLVESAVMGYELIVARMSNVDKVRTPPLFHLPMPLPLCTRACEQALICLPTLWRCMCGLFINLCSVVFGVVREPRCSFSLVNAHAHAQTCARTQAAFPVLPPPPSPSPFTPLCCKDLMIRNARLPYLFGIPAGTFPRTWRAFMAYNRHMWNNEAVLAVGANGRTLSGFLLKV
jgi:hypothetical protein